MSISDRINNARKINQTAIDNKETARMWWDSLSVIWEKMMVNESIEQEVFDLGILIGSGAAYEAVNYEFVHSMVDVRLWDMEQRFNKICDLYKEARALQRSAYGDKQKEASEKLVNVLWNQAKEQAKDMDKYHGDPREDDRQHELIREASPYERSKMLFDYIADNIDELDPSKALKLSALCDRRNKLDKKEPTHLLFQFYVASMVLLQAKLAEEGWGKVKYRAVNRLGWFIEQYDKWDIEDRVAPKEEDVTMFSFKEDMDSDEEEEPTDKVSTSPFLSSHSLEAIIDLKDYCIRQAEERGCTPEDILEEVEDKKENWL